MSANSETEIETLRTQSIVAGNNPTEVIAETEAPTSMDFIAAEGHDYHVRTQITATNPDDTPQSERITVTIYHGDPATGTVLASKRVDRSFAAGETQTFDVHTGEFRLSPGPHHIAVETAGDAAEPIEIDATREFTKASEFTWDITQGGDYELITQDGETAIHVDGEDGSVSLPATAADGADDDTSTDDGPLTIGSNPGVTITETGSDPDPAAITDSTAPTTLSFTAGDGVDVHDHTDVSITNPSGASVTEDVTVELIERATGSNADTTVVSETQSVTRAAGASDTTTFLGSKSVLPTNSQSHEFRVTVSTSGSTLTIDETSEFTLGGEYTWRERADGTLEATDQTGRVLVRYPVLGDSPPEYPNGIRTSAFDADSVSVNSVSTSTISATTSSTTPTRVYGSQRGDPTTSELGSGEVMTFVSDGSGTGAAGDLVYAVNSSGSILTNVIAAVANAT